MPPKKNAKPQKRKSTRRNAEQSRKPATTVPFSPPRKAANNTTVLQVSAPSRARRRPPRLRKHPDPPALPPAPNVGGRPSLYTPALHERVCALVAVRVPIRTACQLEGIGARTLYDWRERGKHGEEPFATFAQDLAIAVARSEATAVQFIATAAADNWKANAWWLERRFPKRYGAKQQLRVTKAPAEMTDDELEAAIAAHGYVRALPSDPLTTDPLTISEENT